MISKAFFDWVEQNKFEPKIEEACVERMCHYLFKDFPNDYEPPVVIAE